MAEEITRSGRVPTDAIGSTPPAHTPRTADTRERHLLSYLGVFEYPVELRTLAAHIAAAERNVPVETVDERVRRGLAVALHHVHLPRLVAAGLVRYDHESRMAVTTGATRPAKWSVGTIDDPHESDSV